MSPCCAGTNATSLRFSILRAGTLRVRILLKMQSLSAVYMRDIVTPSYVILRVHHTAQILARLSILGRLAHVIRLFASLVIMISK